MNIQPVMIVTGATNGLGRLAAIDLARHGAHLGIIARSPSKVEALRREIEEAAPGTPIDVFLANLSSLKEVRRAAEEIDARYERIDVLINNAGLHAFSQRITPEGFGEMVAVNYLAPWILSNTLRRKLISSAPSRIVTVASESSRSSGGITPAEDLTFTGKFNHWQSSKLYGRSKLMDIMFSQEFARQLAGTGVTVNCCCPGFNTTGLGRELPFSGTLEKILSMLRVGDPRRGAEIIVRLATDSAFTTTTGGYFSVDAEPLICPESGRDEDVQRELWKTTAILVADILRNQS